MPPRVKTYLKDKYPEIATYIVDTHTRNTISPKANRTVELSCPQCNHQWTAKLSNIATRFEKTGTVRCPACDPYTNAVTAGINDLATTHPDLAALCENPTDATRVSRGSGTVITWICPNDSEHKPAASPNAILKPIDNGKYHFACPYCAGKAVLPGNNDLATTHPDIAAQCAHPNDARTHVAGSNAVITWQCDKHPISVTWETSIIFRTHHRTGCPVCAGHRVITGINDLGTTHPNLAAEIAPLQSHDRTAQDVTAGSNTQFLWKCSKNAEHTWVATVKDRIRGTRCPLCGNHHTSQQEEALYADMCALLPNHTVLRGAPIPGSTHPGKPQTMDIYIPEYNTAIEFNGCYFHSDAVGTPHDYHANKTALCDAAGITLIHIFSDDWERNPNLIRTMLAYKLHAVKDLHHIHTAFDPELSNTHYARTLTPTSITAIQARTFLNDHHIQGSVGAKYHLGLSDNTGTIRAVLSLRAPHQGARMHRQPGQWEIQRYATYGHVPGGFSKLLTYAEQYLHKQGEHLTQWITFSHNDISTGQLYSTTGFTLDHTLPPDYTYYGKHTGYRRVSKQRFQKRFFRDDPALIFDPAWTEREAAHANKIYRIYDAGKRRWVRNINNPAYKP